MIFDIYQDVEYHLNKGRLLGVEKMSDLRFPDPHPLDAVIWRAPTSIQKGLAEGDQRARRYPAAIAPFAATIDMEAASLRSLLALVGSDDRIALFTTEEVEF